MNPFFETMSNHPDAKLIDIVENKRSDYQKEAVAAAEAVLVKRRVKFKKVEDDEVVVMTVEQIREEIVARHRSGESIKQIKNDFKAKGVDIDSLDDIEAPKEKKGMSLGKMKGLAYLVGSTAAIIVGLNDRGMGPAALVIIAIAVVIALYLLLKKN